MPHELVDTFQQHGLPLCNKLCDMLNETPQHRTERRGCGFTQASRYLSTFINAPRSPSSVQDLSIFAVFSPRVVTTLARRNLDAGWCHGWRQLHTMPSTLKHDLADQPLLDELATLHPQLTHIATQLKHPESLLILSLLTGILSTGEQQLEALPFMADKPDIGSCSQAEEFFLEIAHAKIRRGGYVNLFTNSKGAPLLIEKMQLGESFSALSLAPLAIGGVKLPPGSLIALEHNSAATTPVSPSSSQGKYQHLALDTIKQARFLRLTTLAVAPADRERAFSSQFKRQVVGNMLSPATTTLDDLRHFAATRLPH